jgi:hypothetical protein
MTKEQKEKIIQAEIRQMLKDEPQTLIIWSLAQMGKQVIATNADSLDLKTEATYNNKRYEVSARIKVKLL